MSKYCITTDELYMIMNKFECDKITFTEDNKVFAGESEIDLWDEIYELRRYKRTLL